LLHTPRTDPNGPNSGIRLPPWVGDGEASVRPWMKDARCGQKVRRESSESIPGGVVLLAAARERTSPKVHDMVPKGTQACRRMAGCGRIFNREICPQTDAISLARRRC
jgi:hypothetical protein